MLIRDIKAHLEQTHHNWALEEQENSLVITNQQEVTAILVETDSQLLVESLLYPVRSVLDEAATDNMFMHAQKSLPLTTVGKTLVGGETFYSAFGALSVTSKIENIELEITTLFHNVAEIVELSEELLK